jgi:uncharacterized membrane protein YebE (DUF533 family)
VLGSGVLSGLAGGVAGGAVSGALQSKKGRKHAGTLLKVGGLAAVGGLAWKAYRGYQQSKTAAHPDAESVSGSVARQPASVAAMPARAGDSRGLLLIRAMISAAMADGHIDVEEQTRIFGRLSELDLQDDEKSLILDELRHPASAEQLVEQCTDLATSLEVYAASVLAVDTSCPAGRVYLEDLAEQLALPPVLARNVQDETLSSAGHGGYGSDYRTGRDSGQGRAA